MSCWIQGTGELIVDQSEHSILQYLVSIVRPVSEASIGRAGGVFPAPAMVTQTIATWTLGCVTALTTLWATPATRVLTVTTEMPELPHPMIANHVPAPR